jgi:two-component system phosphate regulon sensor histidine kinase PhoR
MRDETDSRRNERMRADFLANASHELRTPLASLAGFIDTLRGHAKEDPVARERFLDIMAAQAWRMARLIEDLMSLSRIELNEHIRPVDSVDLTLAVSDVVDALGPQAQGAGVAFQVACAPKGQAVVAGDRDQIVQVAQNLVDNAIKYAGRGGRVDVELITDLTAEGAIALRKPHAARLSLLTPDHADEHYAAIRVTDTGPGIKREHLPRLTERFYRVEGQKSGERLGTGLGLAIVKHIMNRHHGGLAVESAAGEGATFVVYFPLAIRATTPAADGVPEVVMRASSS